MVLMGMELPLTAIRSQIASGIDVLVHLGRMRDGSRKILAITELAEYKDGEIRLNDIYRFEESGKSGHCVEGSLRHVGTLEHTEKLKRAGVAAEEV